MTMTTNRLDICQAIDDRLLEGERLTGHPELVDHASSCLDCFRTLTELRELPRIAEVMRAGAVHQAHESDPGPAFWKAVPDRIADEVLGPCRPARPTTRRWWRPAALMSTGLVAAAALALAVSYRPGADPSVATATAKTDAVMVPLAVAAESDDNLPVSDLTALSSAELRALNQRLSQEESGAVRALNDSAPELVADEDGEGTAMARLSSLNGPQLQRLTRSLGLELE
ncbi:MAG TPA: hypothetical protein VH374_03360 [Polyangia bacterium]|jgi:hypothetical protein|nr:hypothetical protein [Polyangia bacterium]